MEIKPLNIVIVEDNTSIRDLFFELLDTHKIKTDILVFDNGLELINYIQKPNIIPDMVFLKMHLPMQNGMRCLKSIRSQRILSRALLVIYSHEATEEEIEEAFVERANIYMNTPKDQKSLDNTLHEILKLAFQYKHSNLSVDNLLLRL